MEKEILIAFRQNGIKVDSIIENCESIDRNKDGITKSPGNGGFLVVIQLIKWKSQGLLRMPVLNPRDKPFPKPGAHHAGH